MHPESRYAATETLISAAINMVLSMGFVFLVFHGHSQVSATGPHGVVIDMAPQTFMVVLMSFLVPALLTRHRLAAGRLSWRQASSARAKFNAFLWAIPVALLSTCVVVGISWLVLPSLLPAGIAFRSLLIAKTVFGGALAAAVTPFAIKLALR